MSNLKGQPVDTIFNMTERCIAAVFMRSDHSFAFLLDALRHDDWRVRYAAAVALGFRPRGEIAVAMGFRPSAEAIAPLMEAVDREDAAPLFSQAGELGEIPAGANTPYSITFPDGATEETIEAWRRRGRLKQAVILTLGRIGLPDPGVLQRLHRYALDQAQDYSVRAAANKALGQIADPSSLPIVRQAMNDEETCTVMEATRSAAIIGGDVQA